MYNNIRTILTCFKQLFHVKKELLRQTLIKIIEKPRLLYILEGLKKGGFEIFYLNRIEYILQGHWPFEYLSAKDISIRIEL